MQLNWISTAASSCTSSDGWSGTQALSGQQAITGLTASTTFTLSCTGTGGSAQQSVTVNVAALPEDPGEAGKGTVAGIDSNVNGVRDDVERYVLLNTTPGPTRQALLARSKLFQSTVVDPTNAALPTALVTSLECLYSLDATIAADRSAELLARTLNTLERARAYFTFSTSVPPDGYDVQDPSEFAQSCQTGADSASLLKPAAQPPADGAGEQQAVRPLAAEGLDDTEPVSAFTVNGVHTNYEGAQANAIEFALVWSELPNKVRGVRFGFAYNPTDGRVLDIVEAAQQSGFSTDEVVRMLEGLIPMDPAVQALFYAAVRDWTRQPRVTDSVVTKHVALYRSRLGQKHKVILVPHSQGNLFVNSEFANLDQPGEQQCTYTVGVATPSDRIPTKGTYVTLDSDAVITLASEVLVSEGRLPAAPDRVPHNEGNGFSLSTLGHDFRDAYLFPGSTSKERILENFNTARELSRTAGTPCLPVEEPPAPPPPVGGSIFRYLVTGFVRDVYGSSGCSTLSNAKDAIGASYDLEFTIDYAVPDTNASSQHGSFSSPAWLRFNTRGIAFTSNASSLVTVEDNVGVAPNLRDSWSYRAQGNGLTVDFSIYAIGDDPTMKLAATCPLMPTTVPHIGLPQPSHEGHLTISCGGVEVRMGSVIAKIVSPLYPNLDAVTGCPVM